MPSKLRIPFALLSREALIATSLATLTLSGCSYASLPPQPVLSTARPASLPPSLPNFHETNTYRVVFSFGSNPSGLDGAFPQAGLVALSGLLYGTTTNGGTYGKGAVFAVRPNGRGEDVLYSFRAGSDGSYPQGKLLYLKGTLYGTTVSGGEYGFGTVFSVNMGGAESVLHSFGGGSDGSRPQAGLTSVNGKLYGTTYAGGTYGDGTVFSITTGGSEKVLHNFSVGQYIRGNDGGSPIGSLVVVQDKLYGTTEFGGVASTGTVFGMKTNGVESMLYSFGGSLPAPRYPVAGLLAIGKTLYGTSEYGGANNWGTIFSVSTTGSNETVIHSFTDSGSDGARPQAGLIVVKGELYGTTYGGGDYGLGTIFGTSLTGTESTLHSFFGPPSDGAFPLAELIRVKRWLYGTTYEGGVAPPSCHNGSGLCQYGTVYAQDLTP